LTFWVCPCKHFDKSSSDPKSLFEKHGLAISGCVGKIYVWFIILPDLTFVVFAPCLGITWTILVSLFWIRNIGTMVNNSSHSFFHTVEISFVISYAHSVKILQKVNNFVRQSAPSKDFFSIGESFAFKILSQGSKSAPNTFFGRGPYPPAYLSLFLDRDSQQITWYLHLQDMTYNVAC